MDSLLTESEKKLIINKLTAKGVKTHCPMCGTNNFTIADGYFNDTLQKDTQNISIGGLSIPSIAIICNNCGFMSQHAVGVLGLLNAPK